MKKPLVWLGVALIALIVVIGFFLLSVGESPNKVIFGGTIYTMEGNSPQAVEAVAVSGDRIVCAGSKDEAIKALGGKIQMCDLKGQTAIPGVIDPHLHLPLAGMFFGAKIIRADEDWNIPGIKCETVTTRDEYLSALKRADAALKDPKELLLVVGYAEYYHGPIDRRDLDKISTTRPILLYHREMHAITLNSKAMETMGFIGSNIPHDPYVDIAKGYFYEAGFFRYVGPKLLDYLTATGKWEKAIKTALTYMHHYGVTSTADMLAFDGFTNDQKQIQQFRTIIDAPEVPLRTYMVAEPRYVFEAKGPAAAVKYIDSLVDSYQGKNLIYLRHAKLFADGGFFAQQMRLKGGFNDGHQGVWITPPGLFRQIAATFWKQGYPLQIHVNGDEGLDMVLAVLADLKKNEPDSKSRVTLHHLGYSNPEQIKKAKKLGVCIQLQPYYTYALSDVYATHGLSPDRIKNFSRANSCLKNGILISFHSDFPMAPANPLTNAWVAVNRVSQISGKVWGPDERIPVYDALRAITIGAAYSIGQENEIGSIKPGKKADLTLLSDDPLKIDPLKIRNIKVTGKFFNGKYYKLRGGK